MDEESEVDGWAEIEHLRQVFGFDLFAGFVSLQGH